MDQHGSARSDETARRPGRERGRGIALGSLLGVPIYLSPSWLILAVVVTYSYAQLVLSARPGLPAGVGYAVGFGFLLALAVSVLLHEFGHALTSQRYGLGVRAITLELLGGYTESEREAPRPSVELIVSLAGPAVSLGIGVVALIFGGILPEGTLARQLMVQLALGNLIVAVFNSLPGLPLDGGRAFQALIWASTGDPVRGQRAAGWSGRLVAVGGLLLGLQLYGAGVTGVFGLIASLLVAGTLWSGASQALRQAAAMRAASGVELAGLVRPLQAVPSGTPLGEVAGDLPAGGATAGGNLPPPVLAVADPQGQVIGLVNEAAAAAVPEHRRAWVAVDTVARRTDSDHVLPVGLRGLELIRAVQADPAGDYLVVDAAEDVIGVVRGADLLAAFAGRTGKP